MRATFNQLTIKDIRKETADTVSIAFDVPANLADAYKYVPGQYLTLKAMINGEDVRRSYSICSGINDNELRVAVKEVENGKFSSYANNSLKAGDQMEVMTPEGGFTITPNSVNANNYVFYAAGSGVTPVLSMIKSILETESNSNVFLYYGNKTAADTIFKSTFDGLDSKYSNFNLRYILSREDSGDANRNGRIDNDKCAHFFDAELRDLKIEGVYTCGPESMIECVKDFYISKGLLHKVHFELFTTPVAAADEANVSIGEDVIVNSNVTVIIDDEEYSFTLKSDGPDVLSAAQDADADVPFSCKGGVCCTCKAKVLEGKVKMKLNYALEEDEVAEGFVLTCQSHPITEKVVISYDEY
ncbi:FAD-binding oxidoreductase [Paracrocinitomix mangrovi]|uniref:2Fe-2S iron-sulfur cluster-binding protein n=1 Tax=Paracrocinitomix mangrovi TaxID=2862509 RepID=UPI001C8D3F18|nr:2Fe-2S iron-sulfur cluster-binding protein [Paracrocinitomix mangrovi]UKN01927.1 FAD-binding oxidoreductase [Paracrocinitomix mangrovi]